MPPAVIRKPNPRDLNLSSALTQGLSDSRIDSLSQDCSSRRGFRNIRHSIGGNPHRVRLNSTYVIALESAGLIPLVVPATRKRGVRRADSVPRRRTSAYRRRRCRAGALWTRPDSRIAEHPTSRVTGPRSLSSRPPGNAEAGSRDLPRSAGTECRAWWNTLIQDIPSEVPAHSAQRQRAIGQRAFMTSHRDGITHRRGHRCRRTSPSIRCTTRACDDIAPGLRSHRARARRNRRGNRIGELDDWWVHGSAVAPRRDERLARAVGQRNLQGVR